MVIFDDGLGDDEVEEAEYGWEEVDAEVDLEGDFVVFGDHRPEDGPVDEGDDDGDGDWDVEEKPLQLVSEPVTWGGKILKEIMTFGRWKNNVWIVINSKINKCWL